MPERSEWDRLGGKPEDRPRKEGDPRGPAETVIDPRTGKGHHYNAAGERVESSVLPDGFTLKSGVVQPRGQEPVSSGPVTEGETDADLR